MHFVLAKYIAQENNVFQTDAYSFKQLDITFILQKFRNEFGNKPLCHFWANVGHVDYKHIYRQNMW